MAELALAASIIQVAGRAADIAIGLYKVSSIIGHAGTEVRLIANEISTTSQVLTHLGKVLKSQSRRQPEARRIAEQHLVICDGIFEESSALLRILKPLIERSGQRRTRNFGLRLKWLFAKSKFSLHKQSLESLKLSLNLLLTSMNYVEASRNQVPEDTFVSIRKQLEMVISIAEASSTIPSRKSSLPMSGSQASGGTSLLLTDFEDGDSETSGGVATPDQDVTSEDQDVRDSFDSIQYAETIDLSRNGGSGITTAPNSVAETEFFDDYEIRDNSQALILYVQLLHLAQDTTTQARKALEGGPLARSNNFGPNIDGPEAPRFALICSTHFTYVAACLALDEECDTEAETSWAHDSFLTFGRIHKSPIVIIYNPIEDTDGDQSMYILQDTLCRRFDSIELVLVIGNGGVPFEISERFDIRLGDVVVGETTSMGTAGSGYNSSGLEVNISSKPTTWWLRQALLKHRSRRLRRFHDHSMIPNNLLNRTEHADLSKNYERPGDGADKLFPRENLHVPNASDCSGCTGAHPRLPREGHRPATHYGNAFIYSGTKEDIEIEALHTLSKEFSTPSIFTRNGYCIAEMFPCLIICGVSSYLDSHAQNQWEGHAEYMAVAYTTELLTMI